jgi:hypothetical protein
MTGHHLPTVFTSSAHNLNEKRMPQGLKEFQKHLQGIVNGSKSLGLLEQPRLTAPQTLAQNSRKRLVMVISEATTCSTILPFRAIVEGTRPCV